MHLTPTQIVMIITVIVLSIYDIYALIRYGLSGTISYQMTSLSKSYPVIPFAMGFLMGHFYGQLQ